eukprot:261454_1
MAQKGVLQVNVIDGNHLQDENDSFQLEIQDPFVIVKVQNEELKTKVVNNCMHPQWNEHFDYMNYHIDNVNNVKGQCIVKDKDLIGSDDFIGIAEFELPTSFNIQWIPHILTLKNKDNKEQGVLTIQIRYISVQQYSSESNENTETKQREQDAYDAKLEKIVNSGGCCCVLL